ncbi:MAG TPA: hypothetical protein VFX50_04875, partial [Gemmatimonadales bacterium]|nr:hypothetical protein [Gemmatimonadales bacterium]
MPHSPALPLLLVALAACQSGARPTAAQAPPAPPAPVPAAGAIADVALLRRALEVVHAGYDRYALPAALVEAWRRLDSAAALGPDQLQFYGEVSRLLAVLRCDHTKAELPETLAAWRRTNPSHLPFRFRLFGRRMFVDVAAAGTGLARGDEI